MRYCNSVCLFNSMCEVLHLYYTWTCCE